MRCRHCPAGLHWVDILHLIAIGRLRMIRRRQDVERPTGVGVALINTMRLAATHVRGGGFNCCGHDMLEEAPRAVPEQVNKFVSE